MSSVIVLWTEYRSANMGIDVFSIKRLKFMVEQDSCIFDLFKLLSNLCLEMPWMVCHTASKINRSSQTDFLDYRSFEEISILPPTPITQTTHPTAKTSLKAILSGWTCSNSGALFEAGAGWTTELITRTHPHPAILSRVYCQGWLVFTVICQRLVCRHA